MQKLLRKFKWAIGAGAVAFALIVVALAGALLVHGKAETLSRAEKRVVRNAGQTETDVNRQLVGIDLMLADIADWAGQARLAGAQRPERSPPPLQDADLQRLVQAALKQNQMLRDIAVVNGDGKVLVSARSSTGWLGLSLPPGFLSAVLAQPFPGLMISSPVNHPQNSEQVLYLARSLQLGSGQKVAAVAEIRLALLASMLDPGYDSAQQWVTLEKESGELLASFPALDAKWGQALAPLPRPAVGQTVELPGRLTEAPSIVAVRPTLYAGVLIAAGHPRAAALADWQAEKNMILGVALSLLLLTGGVSLLAWRYIVRMARARADIAQVNARLTASNEELAESLSLFEATLDATADAVMVEGNDGRIRQYNTQLVRALGVPQEVLAAGDLTRIRALLVAQLRNPEVFWHGVETANASQMAEMTDQLVFKDGRVFQRHSLPQLLNGQVVGRVWSFQDISEIKRAQETLQQSEHHLRSIVETTPGCVKLVSRDGTLLAMNPAGLDMIEADSAEAVLGANVYAVVSPEHRAAFQAFNERVCDGASDTLEFELVGLKGTRRWMETRAVPFPSQAQGELIQLAVTQDITGRKHAEEKLRLAASVFTHAREGITITDTDGTIVDVNDTFSRITGYARDEVLGQNPRVLQSGRQGPDYYAAMWQALLEKGHWYGEVWNRHKNGEVYAAMMTISAVRGGSGQVKHYVGLFTDITSMKEHQRQLEHIAHYDALTSLPNRVLLADRLHQAMAQSQRRRQSLAVVYLDLDGFKSVNDNHGHDVGDQLLITVSQRMKLALRDGDTLARIGGDEFVAVLVDLVPGLEYELVLTRLLQAAADPVTVGAAVLQVSASLGVTLYPQDGADADLLLRHADQAMYAAKQAGKNRYHLFDVAQDAAVQTQSESLKRIQRAVEQAEFVLYYQPKVNMKTGQVIGAEALIRWQHPERGLLAPAAFLPIIEEHPVSVTLGEWVIDAALTQMTEWTRGGFDVPAHISVNVGARQLQQGNFTTRLGELLAAHPEVRPGCLELEILETSAMEDIAQVCEVMRVCREMGVRFALDDFGTGYSSLTYLKRLPAEVLKIDQSFVRDMLSDSDDLAIIQGVIGLASAFRREVIAEGVETAAHGALLLSLGCERAQGYGIARPMPAAELPGWVRRWQAAPVWTA